MLSQVLIASTNPQEVLDAGNWLLQNASLKGKALDDAAAQVGFTPPIRALLQFPETIDMMCLKLGWTTELGEAFTADQAGVLDAVQRLRRQAQDVGNLQSSPQMTVATEVQEGKQVVVLKPAKPEVVYVPQYDPQTVYAPLPPAATTESKGHSTGALITTGLLAFGAGILVNELFDDDDHHGNHHGYYYPNYGHGGMPYYPPYPYRPSYGHGFYPGNGYNRPPGYNSGFQNNGTIIINNNGGNRPGGNYWDRYDDHPRPGHNGNRPGHNGGNNGYNRPRPASSPISAARPNRPELQDLNKRQPRPMPADVRRPSSTATVNNWKGQSGYAGSKGGGKKDVGGRVYDATPAYDRPAPVQDRSRDLPKANPKVQGEYAGARPDRPRPSDAGRPAMDTRDSQRPQGSNQGAANRDFKRPEPDMPRDAQRPSPTTRDVQRPDRGKGDRGYDLQQSRPTPPSARPMERPMERPTERPAPAERPEPMNRPAPSMEGGRGNRGTAVSGAERGGGTDRAASQRGRESLPQGAHSKGEGGGKGDKGGKNKDRQQR